MGLVDRSWSNKVVTGCLIDKFHWQIKWEPWKLRFTRLLKCQSHNHTHSELKWLPCGSVCVCVFVCLKQQYTKTGQADGGRHQLFSPPAMEVADGAPPQLCSMKSRAVEGDLASWSKAKQGIAWLAITGSYTQTQQRFPSYLPLTIMLLQLLPRGA